MNTKDKLYRYRKSKQKIDYLKDRITEVEIQMQSIDSPQITDMPKGHQGTVSLEELLTRKSELMKRLDKELKKAKSYREEAISLIDQVEDIRCCEVLEAYFLGGYDFNEISTRLNYSTRHVRRLYGKGIRVMS